MQRGAVGEVLDEIGMLGTQRPLERLAAAHLQVQRLAQVPALDPAIVGPMEKLSAKYFPGVPVIPSMSTGATDGLYLSAVGIPTYGVPSVKAAWYADVRLAGTVPRSVFWPVPNVDSGLVALTRREPPTTEASRTDVFACVDAAFAQRRKTLRAALASWAGSPAAAEDALVAAGIDPRTRGEQLDVTQFAAVAAARRGRS